MEFLKKLTPEGTRCELVSIKNGIVITTKTIDNTADLYFLGGVDPKLDYNKRAKDIDIIKKNYFCLDLDIRKNYNKEITNEEIIKEGKYLAEHLAETNDLFGEWSYITFSGNGIHIYYIGEPETFTPEQYKLGVKYIFEMWNIMIGEPALFADFACCNLARIMRLPGTINQKNGAKTKIIAEQNVKSRLFAEIKNYKEPKRKAYKPKTYNNDNGNLYEKIQDIPAYELAQMLIPDFPLDKNEKNFRNKKGGFTGYFYVKDRNCIVNGGSRYFNWGSENSCYGPFQIIKYWFNLKNREVFEYFKSNFFK